MLKWQKEWYRPGSIDLVPYRCRQVSRRHDQAKGYGLTHVHSFCGSSNIVPVCELSIRRPPNTTSSFCYYSINTVRTNKVDLVEIWIFRQGCILRTNCACAQALQPTAVPRSRKTKWAVRKSLGKGKSYLEYPPPLLPCVRSIQQRQRNFNFIDHGLRQQQQMYGGKRRFNRSTWVTEK